MKSRIPPKPVPESVIVHHCIQWLWAQGCFVWRNNSGALKPAIGARPIRFGYKGSADIIGATPTGRFIGVECKSSTGRMRPEQELFRDRIQAKQGLYVLARGIDDLEARKREILA